MIAVTDISVTSRNFSGGHVYKLEYLIDDKPYAEYFYADAEQTLAAVYAACSARMADLKTDADTRYTITCQDGTVGTYQPNGTNAAAVSLAISLTTAELNNWATMKPKIKTYLSKCLRLYRRANVTQKAWLRAHNAVLDAVLDMIGE